MLISFAASTPILTLSAVMSVEVIAPLNVEVVLTKRVSVVVKPVIVTPLEVVVSFVLPTWYNLVLALPALKNLLPLLSCKVMPSAWVIL